MKIIRTCMDVVNPINFMSIWIILGLPMYHWGPPIGPKRTIEGSDRGNMYCIRFRRVENLFQIFISGYLNTCKVVF
jgi:hypothetical protein